MAQCGWWIKSISVSDRTVNFYIGVSGNSWSIVLKNSIGAVEASKSGSSYGNHSLTATSYGPHILELTCNWNTSNPCEVCSVNIPPLAGGSISFVSTPPGAEIFIDGADQGVMTPNTAMNVPAGDHIYVLKLAGYDDYSGTVSVISGQTASVTTTLIAACVPAWKCELPLTGYETDGCGNRRANPACNPPQIGSISFASTPPGAEIYIDGADQGVKTPATIFNIPVGTHTYTLKQTGYIDVTGTVDVGLNQTAVASATLTPVAKPGIGAGMILTLLLAAGAFGAVIFASRETKLPTARR